MEQWVGILLGFIVVVALVVAYMYRSSNFEIAPPNTISSAPSGAPLVEAPAQAPVNAPAPAPPAPAPMPPAPPAQAPAPPMMEGPSPSSAIMTGVISTSLPPVPQAPPAQVTAPAPSVGVSTYAPDPMSGEFEPAYEGEYAEIEN